MIKIHSGQKFEKEKSQMSLKGSIIEYIDNGRFICAIVIEESGKRVRILNQNGKEVNLPLARVIHKSFELYSIDQTRGNLYKHLKSTSEKRQQMMDLINLEEIWELAIEENDSLFEPEFLTELCFGEHATDDHVASFMRSVFADHLFFKYREGKIIAHSEETVKQLRIRREKELEKEALLNNGARVLAQLWEGDMPEEWPERKTCFKMLADYYLYGNDAPESAVTRDLLKRAHLSGPHVCFHLLVKAGVWDKNENIPILRHEIPVEFSDAALNQARSLANSDPSAIWAEGRKDFRDLPILTIDGESTRDFDDALHVEKQGENYLVGIHITDVTDYVKPGDPLFQEAVARVSSIYLPDARIPMLPPELSEGCCSLILGKDRAAMSMMVLLSPDGEVLDLDIVPSLIRVRRQLTYSEAEEMIDSDEELRILAMLSRKLMERRLRAGALLLPVPDVNISIDPDETIKITKSEADSRSRILVAEFMVLANTLGAGFVADRESPGLFRSQPPLRTRLIHGYDKDLFLIFRQRKNLPRAELLPDPKPHSSVGAAQYTMVTSPIRRLMDLAMQHQIMHLARGKGVLFSRDDIADLARSIVTVQSRINPVRQLRHRYWILKYLETRKGARFDALIIDSGPRRVHIVLTDFLIDTDLPASRAIGEPGSIVSVRLAKVVALDNIVRFEWM